MTSSSSRNVGITRSGLVVAQIAMTLVLLICAGVALHGLARLMNTSLGCDPRNVLVFPMNPRGEVYTSWQSANTFNRSVLEKVRGMPGVESAAETVEAVPPHIRFRVPFVLQDRPPSPEDEARLGLVSADYFSTLRIPLLGGRLFTDAEDLRSAHFAVVNRAFVRQFVASGRDPIGLNINLPLIDQWKGSKVPPFTDPLQSSDFQIAGIVGDQRDRGMVETTEPAVYVPNGAFLEGGMSLLIRSKGKSDELVPTVRREVASISGDQTFGPIMTLEEQLAAEEWSYPRFSAALFSIFAISALILAAIGIYSVVSYTVAQRSNEFGIRIALGAVHADILKLVLWSMGRLFVLGLALGLAGNFMCRRIIAAYVYDWNARDTSAILVMIVILAGVSVVACLIPASDTLRIDPAVTLRRE